MFCLVLPLIHLFPVYSPIYVNASLMSKFLLGIYNYFDHFIYLSNQSIPNWLVHSFDYLVWYNIQFIEGGLEGDADSGDEEAESSKLDEMDNNVVEHLQLSDEVFILSLCSDKVR